MALDGTYNGLKASLSDWLNRTDAATVAAIPDMIVLAEAQMFRRFISRAKQGLPIPRRLVGRSDATFALATEYVAMPTDMQGPIELLLSSTPPIDLDYIETENLNREKKLARWTGAPKYYAVVGGQIQIYPVADQSYTGELTYIKRLPAASTATNWVLTDYPDAYLYGALVQSAPYLKDDARLTTWGALFTAAIEDICNSDPMPTNKVRLRVDGAITRFSQYMPPYTLATNT